MLIFDPERIVLIETPSQYAGRPVASVYASAQFEKQPLTDEKFVSGSSVISTGVA